MPKATKSSAWGTIQMPPPEESSPCNQEELSISDQEPDPEFSFQPYRQPHPVPSMFMPYIEGPKMDWTVNDGLYHRFLKWHLKCENILECELATLPECQKCKKVVALLGDFGPVCVLELAIRWVNIGHNLGKIWRILQAPIKWGVSPLLPSHKLQTR